MRQDFAHDDPIALFSEWYAEAQSCPHTPYANAMNVATANAEGIPTNRILLLKHHDETGFTFFTNYNGKKSSDLQENPHAALCFYWGMLGKQIRIEGDVVRASNAESDAYFATRPRGSQLGAWASEQSKVLDSPEQLDERIKALEAEYEGKDVPRPPHWGGWTVLPKRIEFWHEQDHRLHERWVYLKTANGWNKSWLNP